MQEAHSDNQKILDELRAIGLARVTDCIRLRNDHLELNVDEISPEQAAAIAYIEKTAGGWKIKFYDKLKALELLGSSLGLFGSTGSKNEGERSNLLEAILDATKEEINVSDIPEIQQETDPGDDLVE